MSQTFQGYMYYYQGHLPPPPPSPGQTLTNLRHSLLVRLERLPRTRLLLLQLLRHFLLLLDLLAQ